MNRALALIGALLLATITISSACMAETSDGISFSLEGERGNPGKIHARFTDDRRAVDRSNWSNAFMPSELIGLDTSGFRSSGTRPLRFALVREAGRLDCSGSGGMSYARGNCRFTADPGFTQLMVSHGIVRPTTDQAVGLMSLNVRRELIEAIAAAGHRSPRIDDLMALAALGVNGNYITGMARAGYRPRSLQSLVELKALDITPEWIGGFVRAGYGNLPSDELVQLKALNVTPEFIGGFERIGYRNIPVQTLVQLKALGITPEFVRSTARQSETMPPVQQLVDLKLFGPRARR
jgi:hypothetical protein